MSSSLKKQLYTATALTFEEMGFILPCSDLAEEQHSATFEAAMEVEFGGPLAGRLVLSVYGGILPTVVANMLGKEEAASKASRHDALGELANVICGNILPEIAGDRALFSLKAPHLLQPQEVWAGAGTSVVDVSVGLDQGRADVSLFVDGGPAALQQEGEV